MLIWKISNLNYICTTSCHQDDTGDRWLRVEQLYSSWALFQKVPPENRQILLTFASLYLIAKITLEKIKYCWQSCNFHARNPGKLGFFKYLRG
ncbi:hypothetical protein [Calothrix sp. UHCC 0171]|uniref:hypothetical protein n=1 Tax=Calothrix sp. UHCC 0171 TaxID=3110245 RepID=UPI002B1EA9C3|nr:hypothetical protein [Calothrix sp. UHCC 0171]MEA5572058.1 hypothetical protein [Calothrix sp. UHCC 0171]